MADIRRWLDQLGLEKYAGVFIENAVDEEVLPELTERDLEALGVLLGDRKKIAKAIRARGASSGPFEGALIEPGTAAPFGARDPEPIAERRQLTVMFCDLVGSTTLSERLDPEDLREVLQRYQEACDAAIRHFGGVVAKYMGDGLLAYFGYPQAHEDDPDRSLRAGLEIIDKIRDLSRQTTQSHDAPLDVHIGVHTGLVVVGEMGTREASERTAIVGETPNIAARLQDLAQVNELLISETTMRLVGETFDYTNLGPQELKGISAPTRVYRVERHHEEAEGLAPAARQAHPLINREVELDLILQRWEQVKEGEGQVVLLSAEPGIGKSRILQAVQDRLSTSRPVLVPFICSPHHQNTALFPLVEQITRGLAILKTDQPEQKLDKLAAWVGNLGLEPDVVVPLLAAALETPLSDHRFQRLDLEPQEFRTRLFESLLQIGVALSNRGPVLMLAEDAHWSDPSMLDFLDLAIDRYRTERILILISFRPTFEPPWIGRPNVTMFTLGNLNREQSLSVISQTTRGKHLPEQVLSQILARTDGVPLYLEELTKAILESGALEARGDRYVLTRPLDAREIPASLQDSLMARLDRLQSARDLVRLAAVMGRSFTHEQLAAVANISEDELSHSLQELMDAEIVYRAGQAPDESYEFKHSLIQQIAYQSLVKSRRSEYHRRIATVFQQRFPEIAQSQPEILARHFTEAGEPGEAVPFWQKAGEQALRRSANIEAVAHFRNGLRMVHELPQGPERIEFEITLLLLLGARLLAVHGFAAPEVEDTYARAKALCESAQESPKLLPVLWGLWGYYVVRAGLTNAAAIADELRSLAESLRDPVALVAAHYSLGVTRFYHGELADALQHFERALDNYSPDQRDMHAALYGGDLGITCNSYLTWVLALMGRPDEARAASERSLAMAREAKHSFSLAFALVFTAQMHHFLRDFEAAERCAAEAATLSKQQGFAQWEAQANLQLGRAWDRRGKEEGLDAMRRGLEAYRATGAALACPYAHAWLAEAKSDRGELDQSLTLVETTLYENRRSGERYYDSELLRIKGELQLRRDDGTPEEAEACFREAIALGRSQQASALQLRAEVSLCQHLLRQSDTSAGRGGLAEICELLTAAGDTTDLREAYALLGEMDRQR